VRVLQVGLGMWGRGWADLIQGYAEVELAAVVDSSSEALAWAVRELDIEAGACYSSLRQATAEVECDAVLIVTPPETHRALAGIALGAGKHVLVEKPLATTLEDAQEIVELGGRAELSIVVGQNYRFTPAARAIKRLMKDGSLGAVVSVRIESRQAPARCSAPATFGMTCAIRTYRTWPSITSTSYERSPAPTRGGCLLAVGVCPAVPMRITRQWRRSSHWPTPLRLRTRETGPRSDR
jgi:predicted dehydrogenase